MSIRLSRNARLIQFLSSDGLRLEGRLTRGNQGRAVVLCHPHPLYGGSMLTPVILTAEQAFQKAGYTTLAFNFRGVGGSAGTHGDGVAEVDDVTGAVEFLGEDLGSIPGRLAVAGYSFGSRVGAKVAATDSRVSLYLGIAPPLNLYDFAFLREAPCRVALIAGNRDEFCDIARLNALGAALPVAPWVRVVDGDHLLTASMQELEEACRAAIAWAEAGEPG